MVDSKNVKSITELQSVTCHKGSHSVVCYLTGERASFYLVTPAGQHSEG